MDLVEKGLQKRCKDVVAHDSAKQDLDLIAQLLNKDSTRRPTAKVALGHDVFQGIPASRVSPLLFSAKDRIEYKTTIDGWVSGTVTAVDADEGSYSLLLDNGERRRSADPARVRALTSVDDGRSVGSIDESLRIPVVGLAFKVNDEVEYYSERQQKWFDCLIASVNKPQNELDQGTYDLKWPADDAVNSPNQVFKHSVVPERLRTRHLPRNTKVLVHGQIPGVVVRYNRDQETYTIQFVEHSNEILDISRDFVAVRPVSE
jgi:hypothetical protein